MEDKTNEPKIIYLQIGEDADIKDFKESDFETNAITWCWERIFDNDIEYISKSKLIALVKELIRDKSTFDPPVDKWDSGYDCGYEDGLESLKQKIESLK